jgi:hypothetical protein
MVAKVLTPKHYIEMAWKRSREAYLAHLKEDRSKSLARASKLAKIAEIMLITMVVLEMVVFIMAVV